MTKQELVLGDYVLATKYSDGDPHDHWVVGFYAGPLDADALPGCPIRHNVIDALGKQFRGNGFRRVKKISAARGQWMLDHSQDIELSGFSVWHFARCRMT